MHAAGEEGDEETGAAGLPSFAAGGRVERTGIALVHEGEYIVPAEGGEAVVSGSAAGAGTVVNYYFPIEIEVVGDLGAHQVRRVAEHVFDELGRELEGLG
ncbi:hypothetical protein [Spirillospora sp. NPDC029432]|uniref:hypothetical protein n=1 Tax=Spirillospora sp. NPDC029432 TaxID=3154599 RepID=UPI003451AF63